MSTRRGQPQPRPAKPHAPVPSGTTSADTHSISSRGSTSNRLLESPPAAQMRSWRSRASSNRTGRPWPNGGTPADGVAGGGAHLLRGRDPRLRAVACERDPLDVHPVGAGGHAHHRVAVADEDDRLRDHRLVTADRGSGVLDGLRRLLERSDRQVESQLAGGVLDLLAHSRKGSPTPSRRCETACAAPRSLVSDTPAASRELGQRVAEVVGQIVQIVHRVVVAD